jgi:hypothetical protein
MLEKMRAFQSPVESKQSRATHYFESTSLSLSLSLSNRDSASALIFISMSHSASAECGSRKSAAGFKARNWNLSNPLSTLSAFSLSLSLWTGPAQQFAAETAGLLTSVHAVNDPNQPEKNSQLTTQKLTEKWPIFCSPP